VPGESEGQFRSGFGLVDHVPAVPAREPVQRGPSVNFGDRHLERPAAVLEPTVGKAVRPGHQDGTMERRSDLRLTVGGEDGPVRDGVLADAAPHLDKGRALVAALEADLAAGRRWGAHGRPS